MKPLNTVVSIALNVLFCTVLLWFFTRNAFLRPYAGTPLKEILAGLLLLGTIYANYFFLYPKLNQRYPHIFYWLVLLFLSLTTGFLDLALAYRNISSCCDDVIQSIGFFSFFSKRLFFIASRNFAFNLFPFLFRERQYYQQLQEKEVHVVCKDTRKLDVIDNESNVLLVCIDDILYCQQQRNFTDIYMVQNKHFTRTGSMKHLEQLFGEEDFIRITNNLLIPFRHIKACKNNTVVMRKMPWKEEPISFELESKNSNKIEEKIMEGLLRYRSKTNGESIPKSPNRPKTRQKPITPPDEKLKAVLSHIKRHPNCNAKMIVTVTKIPLSTVERCIAVLKKQGLIEHTGSKKSGGYHLASTPQEGGVSEENTAEEKPNLPSSEETNKRTLSSD